ncbi:DHS-like NAD/FAD-binding domain-containing protein [Trichoderma austrokoningii]
MGQEESTSHGLPETPPAKNLEAIAESIKSGNSRRIVVLTGAGISTAAGIPDFRSPKTGLYSNLARLKLPYAEAVFDISYFRNRPEPFYVLAQELYPGKFHPTISHAFIALLAQKELLQMLFTQNIDCLERAAGVPSDKIVEAHGSFATQRCIDCKAPFPDDKMKKHVLQGEVPRCEYCKGLVKPEITFFGEALPMKFSQQSHNIVMADLVLIIGTSLTVYPFASLPDMVRQKVPRVLFNMEKVGTLGSRVDDVLELGSSDSGVRKLAELLGWTDELEDLWRSIVGNEEAERQLRSQTDRDEEIEDELQKLTGEIEAVLKLDDEKEDKKDVEESTKVEDEKTSISAEASKDVADAKEEKKEEPEAPTEAEEAKASDTTKDEESEVTKTTESKEVEKPKEKEGEEKPLQN